MNTFKTIARAALILAALGAANANANATAAEPVIAADKTAVSAAQSRDGLNRRVRIHNNTGWAMLRFYASDSRITSWQEDMLGRSTLAAGRNIMMNIDDGSGACLYDFKAEFTNGQVLTRFNVSRIADYYYTR